MEEKVSLPIISYIKKISNMIKDLSHKENLLASLDETASDLVRVLNEFTSATINTIPFEGSWTAAQVTDHITRSNISIARALGLSGTSMDRDPGERVQELKEVFLNFNTKMKSPDFILPTQDTYEKEVVIAHLNHSLAKMKEVSGQSDLSEMIKHPAFGDITKFEILHFVLFHTQRHTHQLANILRTINKR